MHIGTKQGFAPLAAIIIALLILGGGGYAIKKVSDKGREKAKQEQVEKEKAAQEAEKEAEQKREEAAIGSSIHVKLDELNTSGQKGEATITQTGTSTVKVIVTITGKPSKVAMPSHIHVGTCPTPGDVKYPLANVDKGAAQTELPITLEQLTSGLPLAINVHKSATDIKTYVACGDIKAENSSEAKNESYNGGKDEDAKDNGKDEKTETGSAKETKGVTAPVKGAVVTYDVNGFSPKTITIKKGETVVFQNKTGKPASVASNDHPTHLLYPEFDQYKTDQRGKDEFRFTFKKVGTWGYHDHLNATVGGTVVVTE